MDAGEKADVDETGHGTAVASKALGTRYGVAKKVSDEFVANSRDPSHNWHIELVIACKTSFFFRDRI